MRGWFSAVIERRTTRAWTLGAILLLGAAFAAATALALAVGTASGTTTSCANPATLSGSAFEIDADANLVVNTTGCIDWLTGGSGTPFRSGVIAKNDMPSGSGDDAFGQGTAENNANPTIVTGSIPPNKSDLKAFGVYTETEGTEQFLELFWSRVQNPSGTTNMDFELNQKFCDPSATPTNCANNGNNVAEPETPVRTVGDKLITYDLSKGGTVATIKIRTWTDSGWSSAVNLGSDALGTVNSSLIPANATGGATGGLTTALGSQDPRTFGEAAISFDALFPGSGCGTFGSAYLKSRSSDSFNAELKDFVAPEKVKISNCPAVLETTATPTATLGSPISDVAHLTGVSATAGGTITFHLFSDSNCTNEVTTGLSPVTVNGPGDYPSGNFTPSAAGSYYWTASYSGDGSNASASTACGDPTETSEVVKKQSTTSTEQDVIPNDTATVPSDATGTVTFNLYDNGDTTCQGSPVFTQVVNVASGTAKTSNPGGNTTSAYTITTPGTYSWTADFSGDNTYEKSSSVCGTETTTVGFVQ